MVHSNMLLMMDAFIINFHHDKQRQDQGQMKGKDKTKKVYLSNDCVLLLSLCF